MNRGRLALLVPAGAVAWLGSACRPAGPTVRAGTVAVPPSTVQPASDAWMGEPLAEETERAFASAGVVLSSPPGTPQSADYVLTTTLARGRVLSIRVRLIRGIDSSAVFERAFELTPEALGTLPGQIASLVATALGRPTGPTVQPAPTPAYLTYLRARSYRRSADAADVRWAAELFRQVIAADSGFTPAWRGLADALRAIAVAEGRPSPGLEAEWREATRRSATLDSIAAAGRKPVVAGAESREP